MFRNLSYEYGKDFGIRLEVAGSFDSLKKEFTSIKPVLFEMQSIATFRHGLCHLISYDANVSIKHERIRLHLDPKWTTSDVQQSVHIFISSPNNWHGIVVDDWPLSDPTIFKVPIDSLKRTNWLAKISQTDYKFITGAENYKQCILDEVNPQEDGGD